jgi:hypothetical protein
MFRVTYRDLVHDHMHVRACKLVPKFPLPHIPDKNQLVIKARMCG